MSIKFWMILGLAALVSGCGRQETGYRFETRELSLDELTQWGYLREKEEAGERAPAVNSFLNDAQAMAGGGPLALVNALAGVAQKVIAPGETSAGATIIGHAIPAGATVFELSPGKEGSHVYEKKLTSTLGFSVIKLHYKIGYQYAAAYRGKGSYVANVKFIPMRIETDPLWSLRAAAVSEQPTNAGTPASPVAKLGFAITFTAQGPGTRSVTDEFEVEGGAGSLKETIRPFEGR